MSLKKGIEAEGKVVRREFPDKGIIEIADEESKVVVKGTLPGQMVRYRVLKKRNGNYEAYVEEITKRSPLENEAAVCKNCGVCGGCDYQTVPYEEQLKLKEAQIKPMILKACEKCTDELPVYEGIKSAPHRWETRNKMEFAFGDSYKGGPLSLGLHKKEHFYDILYTDDCKIVHSDVDKVLAAVFEVCKTSGLSFYNKMMHRGYLRHLLVRRAESTGEILVAFETSSDFIKADEVEAMKTDSLKEFLESDAAFYDKEKLRTPEETAFLDAIKEAVLGLSLEGKITGLLHLVNDRQSDMVAAEKTEVMYGREYINEKLLGLSFKITTFSFFQTNTAGAEVLYSVVRDYVGNQKDKVVYDLYSGTGTIGQIIASVAKKVIGVEIIPEAVDAANENAAVNNLDNVHFIAGDVFEKLDSIEEKPDFIILDPPRDGVSPKALEKVLSYGVDNIIYVACKPTSLARDLPVFYENGYKAEKFMLVDMFPNTHHVETVVLLSQRKPDDVIEVELELDELDVTSAESKATYAEIKDFVLKEHGLKVSNLYISQVKRKCGIEVGENYNLPKSEDSRQPQCPEEKEKAIKGALEHFGMI